MNKKTFAFLSLLFITAIIYGQEKIGNKLYLYGNLENSVKGKTLIFYGVDDPKGEIKIIERFKDNGIESISWNKLFIPGYSYSDIEKNEIINNKGIQTIIFIKLNSRSTYNQSSSNTSYNSWTNSFNTYGTSGNVIGNVGLVFEIYNIDNGFNKPIAVINGNADNSWGAAGSQRGVTLKVVDRVLNAMKKEKAY